MWLKRRINFLPDDTHFCIACLLLVNCDGPQCVEWCLDLLAVLCVNLTHVCFSTIPKVCYPFVRGVDTYRKHSKAAESYQRLVDSGDGSPFRGSAIPGVSHSVTNSIHVRESRDPRVPGSTSLSIPFHCWVAAEKRRRELRSVYRWPSCTGYW